MKNNNIKIKKKSKFAGGKEQEKFNYSNEFQRRKSDYRRGNTDSNNNDNDKMNDRKNIGATHKRNYPTGSMPKLEKANKPIYD